MQQLKVLIPLSQILAPDFFQRVLCWRDLVSFKITMNYFVDSNQNFAMMSMLQTFYKTISLSNDTNFKEPDDAQSNNELYTVPTCSGILKSVIEMHETSL